MATAATAIVADDHLALTHPQVSVLRLIVGAQRAGEIRASGDPVYCALVRRGLVVRAAEGDSESRFVATMAGRAWMREDQARNGGGPKPAPPVWSGTAATNTRWTLEQALTLARAGADPNHALTAVVLRDPESDEDDWTRPARRVRTEVPRLAITRDGRRAKIVTPSGSVRWLEIVRG